MRIKAFYINAAWNLLGSGLPLCAGLFAIPQLILSLGVDRFGLLNLCWLLVGYFSLFDLGIGRALTRLVAEHLAMDQDKQVAELINTAIDLMKWLGLGAAAIASALSPWLATTCLNVPPELQKETLISFLVLAFTLPFVVLSSGWRGVLEAYGRFDLANWIRIPLGTAIFIAPLLVIPFADGLIPVVSALAATRVLGWWLCRYQCYRLIPSLAAKTKKDRILLKPLLQFGGWMTVSNVIGPLMVYADRFLIGGMISAAAVAYYATPYEIVTRLLIIPGALTSVLFPIFAKHFLTDRFHANFVSDLAMRVLYLVLLPVIALPLLFAKEGLLWWLGSDFATNGHLVARVLAIGVFANAMGHIAITVLHGAGRADWAAKLHLSELPFYLLVLAFAANRYGIVGVAVAWLLRIIVDTLAMTALARRFCGMRRQFSWAIIGGTTALMGLLLWAGIHVGVVERVGIFCVLLLVCGILLPRQLRLLGQTTNPLFVADQN